MTDGWPEAHHRFPVDDLDDFLIWAARAGASDITFQTGAPAFVEIDGLLRRATHAALDSVDMTRLTALLFNATAEGILRQARDIDCSHTVRIDREHSVRFRVNMSPVLTGDTAQGVNITLRVLPGAPPTLASLDVEDEIGRAWRDCRGLTLVTGVPGSGKTTLLAAGMRTMLEAGAGRIQSYEAPIEFTFEGIDSASALMSQSEIPRHFGSFSAGLRSSLRRRPTAVVVGEARDRETVEAVVRAADYGIAVYATTHTIGVAATIRRLMAEFPEDERLERGAALIDVLNLVVTQVLARRPDGGRTALREWLTFDAALKAELLDMPPERWADRIARELAATGNHLAAAADAAHGAGRITAPDHARLRATGTRT